MLFRSPQPTLAAIKSFQEPLTVILGGSDKGLNYDELGREITCAKQIKKVIIIGQIGPLIFKSLNKAGYQGSLINLRQKPMPKIVQNAFRNTPKGGVVLLSQPRRPLICLPITKTGAISSKKRFLI